MNKAFTFAKGHNPSKKGSNLKIEMSLFVSSLNTGSNGKVGINTTTPQRTDFVMFSVSFSNALADTNVHIDK